MICRIIFFIFFISCISCTDKSNQINFSKKFKNYSNKGFTLIYDDKLYKNKFVDKKLNERSLLIFNNSLEVETPVKVTNLINGKYLLARVSIEANYPLNLCKFFKTSIAPG